MLEAHGPLWPTPVPCPPYMQDAGFKLSFESIRCKFKPTPQTLLQARGQPSLRSYYALSAAL